MRIGDTINTLLDMMKIHGNVPMAIETADGWAEIRCVYVKGDLDSNGKCKNVQFAAISPYHPTQLKNHYPDATFNNYGNEPIEGIDETH